MRGLKSSIYVFKSLVGADVEFWVNLRKSVTLTHLHVLVFVLEVHEPMVGSDSLTELAQVYTHSNEILPDLPSLIITLERFLKGAERLLPGTHTHETKSLCLAELLLAEVAHGWIKLCMAEPSFAFSSLKSFFGKLPMWQSITVLFQKLRELPA